MSMRRALTAIMVAGVLSGLAACDDLTGGDDATVVVQNHTTTPVWVVNISPCEDVNWGEDRLGPEETIAPGGERTWSVDPGCYDLRAIFSDGGAATDQVELDTGDRFTWELVD